jgi:hypothetical protein
MANWENEPGRPWWEGVDLFEIWHSHRINYPNPDSDIRVGVERLGDMPKGIAFVLWNEEHMIDMSMPFIKMGGVGQALAFDFKKSEVVRFNSPNIQIVRLLGADCVEFTLAHWSADKAKMLVRTTEGWKYEAPAAIEPGPAPAASERGAL